MLKKLIGVVAVATMAFAATVTASSAQGPPSQLPPNYPPPGHAIACSAIPDFAPGQDVVCNAFTFGPNTQVRWTLFSAPVDLGTSTANAEGVATLDTKLPLDIAVGAHRIEATGVDQFGAPLVLVFEVRIVPVQAPGGSDPLPRTGSSNTVPMAQVAVAVIVAGGFLLLMSNRRRAAVVPATTQQHSTKV